jgi:hypothetical protein
MFQKLWYCLSDASLNPHRGILKRTNLVRYQFQLKVKFFCKTMLPHQDNSRRESPKVRLAGLFLKLNSLQNHGYNDSGIQHARGCIELKEEQERVRCSSEVAHVFGQCGRLLQMRAYLFNLSGAPRSNGGFYESVQPLGESLLLLIE